MKLKKSLEPVDHAGVPSSRSSRSALPSAELEAMNSMACLLRIVLFFFNELNTAYVDALASCYLPGYG
jgi:hypothetical protein